MFQNFVLLLPCIVCLYSAVTLLLNRKKNVRSQHIWMMCMATMSVCAYIWAVYYNGIDDFEMYYKLDVVETVLGLTFFPFVYLYLRSLFDETPLGWKAYSCFLPSALIGIVTIVIYAVMGKERILAYLPHVISNTGLENFTEPIYKIHFVVSVLLYYVIFALQIVALIRYAVLNFMNYRRRLEEFYSDSDAKSIKGIRAMLIGVIILLIIFFFAFIDLLFLQSFLFISILSLLYAATLYGLSYYVPQIEYTIEILVENQQKIDKEAEEKGYLTVAQEGEGAAEKKSGKFEAVDANFRSLLNDEKIFLKHDLRIDDIVRLTQTNRTYLSLFIKEEYQCTFSELINRKRIEYAQQMIKDNPKMLYSQVAEKSGFSHASSFSRVFKQYVGVTFKEWCQQVR